MEEKNQTTENDNSEYAGQLINLSRDLLSDEGQDDIDLYVHDSDFARAREYLLGALDRRVFEGRITEEEAKQKYHLLNIDHERASRLRQSRATKG